jgi:hypothetical protein
MPGNARWKAMIEQAHTLLSEAAAEMPTYHDDRSEPWQESEKAVALLRKLEPLQETVAQLQDLDSSAPPDRRRRGYNGSGLAGG